MSLTGELETLYRTRRQGLFTYALSLLGDAHLAEDAVQDVFRRLCGPAGDRIAVTGNIEAFVYRCVRNQAIDLLRQRRRHETRELVAETASIFDADEGPPSAAISAELSRQVRAALEALPAREREVIVLHLYGDLTFEAAANVLELPQGTVASHYRRGLERLRETLKGRDVT